MLNGILGKKLGMTRLFTEKGHWVPVTVIEAGPCTVVQRRTSDTDGYDAVQLGLGTRKKRRCTKAELGHFKKAGVDPQRHLREFRVASDSELKTGDTITVEMFKPGDVVDVTGTSKGKGTQGVMKRHGFGGGPGTHGSNFHRRPGSIGQSADPSKVIRGLPMGGHMGHVRVTTQNLEVVDVKPEKNLIVVRGAVPGANGGLVTVRRSVKGK